MSSSTKQTNLYHRRIPFVPFLGGAFCLYVQVSRERQETGGREGGMTCRIGPLSVGFEPGSPAARTVASTDGAGALPTEQCSTPPFVPYSSFNLLVHCSDGSGKATSLSFRRRLTFNMFHIIPYCCWRIIISPAFQ